MSEDTEAIPVIRTDRSRRKTEVADRSRGLRAGDRIGNLEIVRSLGAGGMGEVYAAFDETLRRKVAVKAIADDRRLSRSAQSRFLREARLLSQLDHPNICRVYDFVESEAGEFLVLELIEGEDLGKALRRELGPRRRLEIARAVASALAAAHGAGIVHRDLKPGNVMLTASDEVKVLDFGLARNVEEPPGSAEETVRRPTEDSELSGTQSGIDDPTLEMPLDLDDTLTLDEAKTADHFLTALGSISGTPLFMSPEQALGEHVGTASDMYSFGLLLQAIETGRSPYPEGLAGPEILEHARYGRTLPMLGADADLRKLVDALKAHAPASRPTAATVLERLDWILDRPKRRRRQITVAALLAIVTLASIKYTIDLSRERNLAVEARQVAEQRRDQAEDLIGFMLGDLRKKLEPMGRLEILEDVGDHAMEYFASVREEELSDSELLARSKALYQIGEVRIAQGDLPGAEAPLRESLALAEELSARDPRDGDRLFGVGQSHYWVGYVHWFQGDLEAALSEYKSYLEASEKLVEIDPSNLEWQLEVGYALTNLAGIYHRQGKLEQALVAIRRSNDIKQELALADPADIGRAHSLANGLSWLGSILWSANRADESLRTLRAEAEIRTRILEEDPIAPASVYALATSHELIGDICLATGDVECALALQKRAVDGLAGLVLLDETNSTWRRELAVSRRLLGGVLLEVGRRDEAREQYLAARRLLEQLIEGDGTSADWQRELARTYAGLAREHLAGDPAGALALARTGIERLETLEGKDVRTSRALAEALLLAGLANQGLGRTAEAREAWTRALDCLDAGPPTEPSLVALDYRAQAMLYLGRDDEARSVVERLTSSGYGRPLFVALCRTRGLLSAAPPK